jgi:putative transposase
MSERRACQAMQMNRSSYRYSAKREPMDAAYRRVVELSGRYLYWGYRKIYALLRAEGVRCSRERVRGYAAAKGCRW